MLVLSRERGETVNIGDDIEVTIIDIRGDKVRLGVSAPRHVAVHRKEVFDAIRRQKQTHPGAPADAQPESASRATAAPDALPGGDAPDHTQPPPPAPPAV